MSEAVNNGYSKQDKSFSSDIAPSEKSWSRPPMSNITYPPHVIDPHPGCLVLGRDALKGNKYVTRYR